MSKSPILAVKALNQYRKRDVISYIGLRYYLNNSASRKCRWIRDVSCRLSTNQNTKAYLKTYHFKDNEEDGSIRHRDIYLPAPNESLSETALLTELSKHPVFHPKPYVYSYRFADVNDKSGVFKPYFTGFKERQADIAKACWEVEGGVVLITDIKKFYPNICSADAMAVWDDVASKSELTTSFKLLGDKLLKSHKEICDIDNSGKGLLTGPVFSHLIANLLLDSLDIKMNQLTDGKYFRYVDDITLVGTPRECSAWRSALVEHLSDLSLELHTGDKDFEVLCGEWLEGEKDFESHIGIAWVSFIADTKRYLIAKPHRQKILSEEFIKNDIKLPVLDYSQLVNESSSLQKFQDWIFEYKWSFKAIKKIDIDYLLESAKRCKVSLLNQLEILLEQSNNLSLYQRKRLIPKLRYITGRLVIFADTKLLLELVDRLESFPELNLITSTMKAVATRDVTEVAKMGANSTQAAAQLLRVLDKDVTIETSKLKVEHKTLIEQSLAILSFNDINYSFDGESSELLQLAKTQNMRDLMSSDDSFIKEMACLHGVTDSLNTKLMNTAFDRDEELALDIINQLQQSSHA
jgi:hypothetical protein